MRRMFHAKYTRIGNNSPALIKAVKIDLTRHVASTLDALQDETRYALDRELGTCEDWTKVVLYQKLLRIVALLSGRIFVGRPLSRSEDWINSSIRYTVDCVAAKERVIDYPAWIRYFVVPFLPEIRRVNEHRIKGAKLLKPIVDRCITRFREGKVAEGDEEDEFDDQQGSFVSWVMKWTDVKNRENPSTLAENQLTCKKDIARCPFIQLLNQSNSYGSRLWLLTEIQYPSRQFIQQLWLALTQYLISSLIQNS